MQAERDPLTGVLLSFGAERPVLPSLLAVWAV